MAEQEEISWVTWANCGCDAQLEPGRMPEINSVNELDGCRGTPTLPAPIVAPDATETCC